MQSGEIRRFDCEALFGVETKGSKHHFFRCSIQRRYYSKKNYLEEYAFTGKIEKYCFIKVDDYPTVLIITPSLHVTPTVWKTISDAKEAFRSKKVFQKRYQISDEEKWYVFTEKPIDPYSLRLPVLLSEEIASSDYLKARNSSSDKLIPKKKIGSKSSSFSVTADFIKTVKGAKKHHIIIKALSNNYSDYEETGTFDFCNVNYALVKTSCYPKVLVITTSYNIRPTIWDSLKEARDDLNNYKCFSHRFNLGELGTSYILSPFEEKMTGSDCDIPVVLQSAPVEPPKLKNRSSDNNDNNNNQLTYIEKDTGFSKSVIRLGAVSFKIVRMISVRRVMGLSDERRDALYEQLDHGRSELDSVDLLDMYLFSFGKMHEAKLSYAFRFAKKELWKENSLSVIDYGCGQGTASLCFRDYLERKRMVSVVKEIILIDPSKVALSRAGLLCKKFYPRANIIQRCMGFDSLSTSDLITSSPATVHLLSNVTDLKYSVKRLASTVNKSIRGENYFVVVSPYYGGSKEDQFESFVFNMRCSPYYKKVEESLHVDDTTCTCQLALFNKRAKTK